MKKILSIGNLFVKRIGFVAILLATIGVGDVWAKAKSTVNATANPSSGAGTAQVSASATSEFGSSATQTTGETLTTRAIHTYYLKATTTSAAWLWKGWYNNDVLAVSAQTSDIQVRGTASLAGGSTYTYTATWLQPKVTGTTAGEDGGTNIKLYTFGEYTDPTIGSETKSIVFTLENNDAGLIAQDGTQPEIYYTEALTGSWTATTFVKNSHTYAKGNQNYTYNIAYKLSGVHATNITADIKLTSKYGGTNCTARLKATENYTPYFKYAYEKYNYTPNDPLAEGQSLTQTFNVSKECYAANNGVWAVSLSADAAAKGFTLQTAADNPNATVRFEALPGMNKADLTTTLTAVCTYTDARGTKVTYTQTILLSGDVGKIITIDGAEVNTMTFDIDYAASGESTQTLPFVTTLTGLTTTPSNLPAGDFITYTTWVAGLTEVSTTVKHNLTPGQYTPSIKYSYNSDEVYALLHIVANIRLAKPVVTATIGMGQKIQLDWQDIYGASSYIVKSGETVLATILSDGGTPESTCTITNIAGKQLITGVEYSFTVTAVYESNTFGNRTSDEVTATPSMPSTVTIDNASTLELYTGTEMFVEGHSTYGKYPYHKKQQIDLTALFNEGVAAFDKVFIFGLTINNDASTVTVNGVTAPKITQFTTNTNSNAVTPCYVYTKSGNNYVLSKTIDNVNITTKPTEFNISTTAGNKIYLTGYAPFASCGTTWEENAVFLFTGQETVDIYLDNLELYARSKAVTGVGLKVLPTKNFTVNTSNLGSMLFDPDIKLSISPLQMTVFTRGSGAAFAFTTTSTSSSTKYQPTIHLRGYNVLESTSGCNIFVDVDIAGKKMQMSAQQHSSPIQIQVNKTGHANKCETELTLDDIWVGTAERTNGYLNLANRNVRLAPTIDLGDEYSTLTFNGGQYYLSNAANDPNLDQLFTVSYAISYRLKSMYDGLAVMYGLGDDQPGAKVRFKDGSFTCAELPETHFQEKLYHNRFSMKCPFDTKVDGGTFNSDVLVCSATDSKGGSPTNSTGAALCKVPIPVVSTTAKGLAVLPTGWMNIARDNGAKTDTLGYYGIKSLAPATIYRESGEVMYEKGVNMLLPSDQICFLEMVRVPTVFCNPLISTTAVGTTIERGGNLLVPYTYNKGSGEEMTKVQLTSRFVYTEVDDYLRYANQEGYQTPLGTNLTIADDANAYVSNTDKYVIKDKIYWIRPIVANEWKMVVPPFDVSNIYVVESYPEAKLLADFGDGKKITGDQIYNARIAQAKRMLNFMFYWLYDDERAYDSDLWSKINSTPYSPFVAEWVGFETKTDDADPSNDQLAYTPSIQQLYHFTGSNWDANYYLYESDGEWEYSAEEGFITDWKLVTTQSKPRTSGTPKTIMKKGGIYAMSFPYTVGKHDPDAAWDYWTGKYIIMEGYPTEYVDEVIGDAQVLSGTTTDWNNKPLSFTVFADYSGDGASLRGNQTFGQLTLQKTNDFFLKSDNTFEPFNSSKSINPGEGFLLANISAPSGMPQRRIASIDIKSGAVTYEEGEDSPTTSVTAPTIAGDRTIVVYTIPNGLGVIPIVPQYVSIYNTAGQLVISQYISGETQFDLPSGIYLVSGETDRAKAMVK